MPDPVPDKTTSLTLKPPFQWAGRHPGMHLGRDGDVVVHLSLAEARAVSRGALGDLARKLSEAADELVSYREWQRGVCTRCYGDGVEDMGSPACCACGGSGRKGDRQ